MEIVHHLYLYWLFGSCVLYLMLSYILSYVNVPREDEYRPYRYSRKLMSVGLLLIGSIVCIKWIMHSHMHLTILSVIAVSIIYHYLICIVYSHLFLNLLDHDYSSNRQFVNDFTRFVLAATFSIAALMVQDITVAYILLFISIALLMEFIFHFLYIFYNVYKKTRIQLTEYYSDDASIFLKWTYRSINLMILYGLGSIPVMFLNDACNLVFQVFALFVNIYVFTCFENYRKKYQAIELINHAPEVKEEPVKKENSGMLSVVSRSMLNIWISQKGFCKNGITIDQLAQAIGTNRYYLSTFINSNMHCSYSEWIAQLRIDEAKRLLKNSTKSVDEVALSLGFSSTSYFIRTFSKREGVSPSFWRSELEVSEAS